MKARLIISSTLVVILALSSCKEKKASSLYSEEDRNAQATAVVDPENAPKIKLKEESFNFGDVYTDTTIDHYFSFVNEGKVPLIIKDAQGSCGCTVPVIPTKPIAVGAKDSIKVTFSAAGAGNGKQQKTVALITNTVEGKHLITISANVIGAKDAPKDLAEPFG